MKFLLQTFFKGLYFFITDKSFRTFVRLSIFYGSSKRYVIKQIGIPGAKLKVADAKSFIWQYYEIYFRKYYDFKADHDTPIIVDCGSNIGLSILHFKEQYPKAQIHCFEPDPKIFNILKSNAESNQLSGLFLNQNAAWVKHETLSFASEGADGGQISQKDGQISVQAIDLAEYLSQFESIDFLKIDIEGAEISLIPHISKELLKVKHLFVEFHSYNNENQILAPVIESIASAGFRIYIDNVAFKQQPFINTKGKYGMDLQLNIFAFRS
jgi:FkbM family methyltransferase